MKASKKLQENKSHNDKILTILMDYLDSLFTNNICGVKRNEENILICNNGKQCCRDCKFLTFNGCGTKCLGCKLYSCSYIRDNYPLIKEKLGVINSIVSKIHIQCKGVNTSCFINTLDMPVKYHSTRIDFKVITKAIDANILELKYEKEISTDILKKLKLL